MMQLGKRQVVHLVLVAGMLGVAAMISIIQGGARPGDGSQWWRAAVSLGLVVLVLGALYYVDRAMKRDERRILATGARGFGRVIARKDHHFVYGWKSSLTVVWTYNGHPRETMFLVRYKEWLKPGIQVELIADPAEAGHLLLRVGRDEYISSQDLLDA
jgi:hypothetical protein